ncbi:MAG: M56 family metallopeptidase [Evtepia sp.]
MTVWLHTFSSALLSMSLAACPVILAVLLARLPLGRVSKGFSCLLWGVVLFRLLCPAAVPVTVPLSGDGAPAAVGVWGTAGQVLSGAEPLQAAAQGLTAADVLPWLWLAGAVVLALTGAVSLVRLRRQLVGAVPLSGRVYLADRIPSPFVLGLIRPKIYLPSDLEGADRTWVLRHEQAHIRRGDPIWKALAFLALCLHWFNPLVWVAFFLGERDMEMACDERAARGLSRDQRADYASLLLRLSAGTPAGLPLAFGQGNTAARIKHLLQDRRTSRRALAAAGVVVLALAVVLVLKPTALSGVTAGQAAVVTQDTVLEEAGYYTLTEGGVTIWDPLPAPQTLAHGTTVWVRELEGDTARIQLMTGDTPGPWGDVPIQALSQAPADLAKGDWAMLDGTRVHIDQRDGDQCQVSEPGGGSPIWVDAKDLSFDFN